MIIEIVNSGKSRREVTEETTKESGRTEGKVKKFVERLRMTIGFRSSFIL